MIPRQAVGRLALHRRLISTYATRGMFYVRRGMVGVQPLTDATVLNQTLLFRLGAVARESRLPNEQRTAEVAKRPAEDLANQARYLDQLGRHGSQFIDEIRYRRGIRLPARGTDGILPTTTPADQKSSMGAAWPETEASRASLVTNGAPSFSASTM